MHRDKGFEMASSFEQRARFVLSFCSLTCYIFRDSLPCIEKHRCSPELEATFVRPETKRKHRASSMSKMRAGRPSSFTSLCCEGMLRPFFVIMWHWVHVYVCWDRCYSNANLPRVESFFFSSVCGELSQSRSTLAQNLVVVLLTSCLQFPSISFEGASHAWLFKQPGGVFEMPIAALASTLLQESPYQSSFALSMWLVIGLRGRLSCQLRVPNSPK